MSNVTQELKEMMYLSGRMNRRSYVMNLLTLYGLGYIGAVLMSVDYITKALWVLGWAIIIFAIGRELALASRRIHDLNGPTFLAFIYVIAAFVAIFTPTLAKIMILVKIGLSLMPGDRDANVYGDPPESKMIV